MKRFRLSSALVLTVLLAACGKKEATPAVGMGTHTEPPPSALVLGTTPEFPPFAMHGGADGAAVVGFDVVLAQAIAAKAGRPLKIEELPYDLLLPALQSGKVDLVLAGLAINPQRAQTADFSEPYYRATKAVVLVAGGPIPETKANLKGMKIAVQLGTAAANAAGELAGPENVRPFATVAEAVAELMNGNVDCLLMDEQPARLVLQKNPALMMERLDFAEESYGAAVKQGNAELLATINTTLVEIMADGRYDRFVDDWILPMEDATE